MNKKVALIIMFFILGIVLIFHFLILTNQIPYEKVWAGKLNSIEEMKSFETISILLNIFMLTILIVKYKQLKRKIKKQSCGHTYLGFCCLFCIEYIRQSIRKKYDRTNLWNFYNINFIYLMFYHC